MSLHIPPLDNLFGTDKIQQVRELRLFFTDLVQRLEYQKKQISELQSSIASLAQSK